MSEESEWSERIMEMKRTMDDKNSERRKTKPKNSTPSRSVSRKLAILFSQVAYNLH